MSLRPPDLRIRPLNTPSQTPPPADRTSSFGGRTRPRLLTAYTSGTTPADRSRFHRACRFLQASTHHLFLPNRTRFEGKTLSRAGPTSFPDPDSFPGKSHSSNAAPFTPTPPFALLHLTSLGLRLQTPNLDLMYKIDSGLFLLYIYLEWERGYRGMTAFYALFRSEIITLLAKLPEPLNYL